MFCTDAAIAVVFTTVITEKKDDDGLQLKQQLSCTRSCTVVATAVAQRKRTAACSAFRIAYCSQGSSNPSRLIPAQTRDAFYPGETHILTEYGTQRRPITHHHSCSNHRNHAPSQNTLSSTMYGVWGMKGAA